MVSFDNGVVHGLLGSKAEDEIVRLAKANRAKDKRLQKLYGITIETYSHMLLMQDGVCAICKHPPGTKSLSVDHDHKWKYYKIVVNQIADERFIAKLGGCSAPTYVSLRGHGSSKKEARDRLKGLLKRASVRGLLCFSCNGGLRKYRDNPEYLANAAEYLRRHQLGEF